MTDFSHSLFGDSSELVFGVKWQIMGPQIGKSYDFYFSEEELDLGHVIYSLSKDIFQKETRLWASSHTLLASQRLDIPMNNAGHPSIVWVLIGPCTIPLVFMPGSSKTSIMLNHTMHLRSGNWVPEP